MKKQFNFRIPIDVLEKIQFIAEIEERSTSQEITFILRAYIKEYEQEYGTIECGTELSRPN